MFCCAQADCVVRTNGVLVVALDQAALSVLVAYVTHDTSMLL